MNLAAKPTISFRHTAGFGRRIEYWIIGKMLKEGLDVYVPVVDDFGIDAVIRKHDNSFIEVQIKARSATVKFGDAALFAAIEHAEVRNNYYFVFYAERLDAMWIMSSQQFIDQAAQNKTGKNVGKRSIWFNGRKGDSEYCYPKFDCFKAVDFRRFREVTGLVAIPEGPKHFP